MENTDLLKRMVLDPSILAGKSVIVGTRIPVELIVMLLAQGVSETEILADYPNLALEDIRAALAYAASTLSSDMIEPLFTTS